MAQYSDDKKKKGPALVTRNQDGYSFTGTQEDADRFFAPVAEPVQQPQQAVRTFAPRPEMPQPTKEQLAALDPRAGWGWNTRRKILETQLDAAKTQFDADSAMAREGLQQAGATTRQRMGDQSALQRQSMGDTAAMAREQVGNAAALERDQASFAHQTGLKKTERGWAMEDDTRARGRALEDEAAKRQFEIYKETGRPDIAGAIGAGPVPLDITRAPEFIPSSRAPIYEELEDTDEEGNVRKRIRDRRSGQPLPEDYLDEKLRRYAQQ